MLELEINGSNGKFKANLPTDLKEVSNAFLESVSKTINVAKHYSLIALLFREPITMVLNATKKRDGMTTAVVPVFVKTGGCEEGDFVSNLTTGTKLLIPGSSLALALHTNLPDNDLNIEHFLKMIENDDNIRKESFKIKTPIVFVDFKIIANNELRAAYTEETPNVQKHYIPQAIDTQTSFILN